MTKDVIALTPTMPDVPTLLAGLYAGGPDLRVRTAADGAVVQLCTPDGSTLVSIETPILIHTPGEPARLLGTGTTTPDSPVWWTEARATTAIPEAGQLAGSFAGRLATVLNGTTWPPEAATTEVIPLTTDNTATPANTTPHPAIDVLTDTTALVLQDRPVIPMTSWLSDALRTAITSDRALHIVTPNTARLTLPTRNALGGHPHRWVVQDPHDGYYDGLSGAVLRWQNGTFTPVSTTSRTTPVAQAFTNTTDTGDRQLILALRTHHPADEQLILGRALETTWHHLTGTPPAGWSTAEPVNLPWSPRQLTDLARRRAPQPTWLIAIGHPDRPALATIRIARTPAGVEEDITLSLGYGEYEPPPLEAIPSLAEALTTGNHGLTSMLTSLRHAPRDLAIPPHITPPPTPIALTLGPDTVHDIGTHHAQHPPLSLTPTQLGPASRPALHYALGDATDDQTWTTLKHLTQHLRTGA
ncbi:DUF6177 family protein [Streptomyces violaceusniger]|uniref:Uncharacterized protein n=1 Tax=Streptomyces violaceusniger (strain Tu 4113) TaxID=653045 RepID=G2P2S1_STRV4|nr:DUF6177 family protein [Streptomyces violaceusniger]AEM82422.1 hypothetical protein Strvi_2711 [Streptomyces violaceusniger Tu 4113]